MDADLIKNVLSSELRLALRPIEDRLESQDRDLRALASFEGFRTKGLPQNIPSIPRTKAASFSAFSDSVPHVFTEEQPKQSKYQTWVAGIATYDTEDRIVFVADVLYAFFTTVATIITANLLVVYFPNSQNIAPEENNDSYTYMNLTSQPIALTSLQLVFFLWMVTRIFIRQRKNEYEVVDDVPTLASMYVTSKAFFLDAFMTIPVEMIFIGTKPEAFAVLASRHLFRWFRCISLSISSNPLAPTRIWYLFYLLVFGLITFVHIAAVTFPMVEGSVEGDVAFPFPLTYVTSLYFIVTTVTSVGYGDCFPTQAYSRSFIIATQVVGICTYAGLTAYTAHYLTNTDTHIQDLAATKQRVKAMLQYYNVPWKLRREVMMNMQPALERRTEDLFLPLLSALPLHLRHDIQLFQRIKLLRNVPILRELPEQLLGELARRSNVRYFSEFETIVSMNEVGDQLHIIIDGKVELSGLVPSGNVQTITTLRSGHYFGEAALFEPTMRLVTVRSLQTTEILTLSRSTFQYFVDEIPELAEVVTDYHDRIRFWAANSTQFRLLRGEQVYVDDFDFRLDLQTDIPESLLQNAA